MSNNIIQQIFIMNMQDILKEYAMYKTFNKSDSIINMRIPKPVLDKIKELANTQKVPYQTLISSVLFSLANVDNNK